MIAAIVAIVAFGATVGIRTFCPKTYDEKFG